jgi:hypothetical protein
VFSQKPADDIRHNGVSLRGEMNAVKVSRAEFIVLIF